MRLCVYCGGPLPKGRCKYCSDVCSTRYFQEYIEPFWWTNARSVALKRAGGRCEECGSQDKIEVHHVVYLEPGDQRWNNPKNVQSNLLVLCRQHHEQTHHPATSAWTPSVSEAHQQIPLPLEAS